jgi:hypothetical protein
LGKERKVEQERAKRIEIWTELKRKVDNNKFKNLKKLKTKIINLNIYLNFFLVMERNWFHLVSVSVLDTFL